MKIIKKFLIVFALVVILAIVTVVSALAITEYRTQQINNDYYSVYSNSKYLKPVSIGNIELLTQSVSCGYAVIEMFSSWSGGNITESDLYDIYGTVTTSTDKSFCNEMNKQFPQFKTTMYSYLTNTELIDKVYDCLSKNIPVPFSWAAKYENEWTLHYSLITGMDLKNDKVTVANPYGYIENLTIKDFLERTSFNAYENLPIFLKLGFAFSVFEKNTIFIAEQQNKF